MGALGPGALVTAAILAALGVEGIDIAKAINDGDLAEALPVTGPGRDALAATLGDGVQPLIDGILAESDSLGRHIFNVFIDDTLNVRAGATEAGAADAIATLERVLGVSAQLPLIFAQIGGVAKLLLGNRAESFENSAIAHLPEELGLNFFLAEILASLFKTAVGTPLEESINIVHRPARLQANMVVRLLKQHKIDKAVANDYLIKAGFRDEDIPNLLAADDTFMSVSELQEGYLFGLFDETVVADHLHRVGYDDATTLYLTAMIVQKAQTQGGDYLRSVARSLVQRNHMTVDQFAAILRQANVPEASITLEVEAINLLLASDRVSLSVAQIKQGFQHGILSQDTVLIDLGTLGYSDTDAMTLIQIWIDEGQTKSKSINENRILSYLLSGVITKPQAILMLIAQGVTPGDAAFLADHPSVTGSTFAYPLNIQTVLSALKEGVITQDSAASFATQFNIDPAELELEIAIALKQLSRKKVPKSTAKTLTLADYERGYNDGLIADSAIHTILVNFGYSPTDADLLYAEWFTKKQGTTPDGWTIIT